MGTEKQRGELHRQLDLADKSKGSEGTIKFLRGDYGCGWASWPGMLRHGGQNEQLTRVA